MHPLGRVHDAARRRRRPRYSTAGASMGEDRSRLHGVLGNTAAPPIPLRPLHARAGPGKPAFSARGLRVQISPHQVPGGVERASERAGRRALQQKKKKNASSSPAAAGPRSRQQEPHSQPCSERTAGSARRARRSTSESVYCLPCEDAERGGGGEAGAKAGQDRVALPSASSGAMSRPAAGGGRRAPAGAGGGRAPTPSAPRRPPPPSTKGPGRRPARGRAAANE